MSVIGQESDRLKPGRIQQDWNNREFVHSVTLSLANITSFLNYFDLSCKHRLAMLNSKMSELERKLDHVESRIEENLKRAPASARA